MKDLDALIGEAGGSANVPGLSSGAGLALDAASKAVPNARLRTLKGRTHNVKPEVLAPVVAEFFAA